MFEKLLNLIKEVPNCSISVDEMKSEEQMTAVIEQWISDQKQLFDKHNVEIIYTGMIYDGDFSNSVKHVSLVISDIKYGGDLNYHFSFKRIFDLTLRKLKILFNAVGNSNETLLDIISEVEMKISATDNFHHRTKGWTKEMRLLAKMIVAKMIFDDDNYFVISQNEINGDFDSQSIVREIFGEESVVITKEQYEIYLTNKKALAYLASYKKWLDLGQQFDGINKYNDETYHFKNKMDQDTGKLSKVLPEKLGEIYYKNNIVHLSFLKKDFGKLRYRFNNSLDNSSGMYGLVDLENVNTLDEFKYKVEEEVLNATYIERAINGIGEEINFKDEVFLNNQGSYLNEAELVERLKELYPTASDYDIFQEMRYRGSLSDNINRGQGHDGLKVIDIETYRLRNHSNNDVCNVLTKSYAIPFFDGYLLILILKEETGRMIYSTTNGATNMKQYAFKMDEKVNPELSKSIVERVVQEDLLFHFELDMN